MPITVLNPTSHSEAHPIRMARTLSTLDGALVGILNNSKVNADRIFAYLESALREKYGVREVIWRRKHDFSRPAPAAMLAELSACDAIVTGIGD